MLFVWLSLTHFFTSYPYPAGEVLVPGVLIPYSKEVVPPYEWFTPPPAQTNGNAGNRAIPGVLPNFFISQEYQCKLLCLYPGPSHTRIHMYSDQEDVPAHRHQIIRS